MQNFQFFFENSISLALFFLCYKEMVVAHIICVHGVCMHNVGLNSVCTHGVGAHGVGVHSLGVHILGVHYAQRGSTLRGRARHKKFNGSSTLSLSKGVKI